MMGSQSSRIAAYMLGFDYTGLEIDTDFYSSGNKRFEEWTTPKPVDDSLPKLSEKDVQRKVGR